MEAQTPRPSIYIVDTINHQGMEMNIEIQSRTEALDHRHRSAPTLPTASPPRPGNRQHELPHRYPREHPVHPSGRKTVHPPAAAGRTETPPLAGEGHQLVGGAAAALNPGEALSGITAGEKACHLPLGMSGQEAPDTVELFLKGIPSPTNDRMEKGITALANMQGHRRPLGNNHASEAPPENFEPGCKSVGTP
jgi:hypothetical protein